MKKSTDSTELPNWLRTRHGILWAAFAGREFVLDEATTVLREKNKDDEKTVNVILSDLKKNGWLEMKLDSEDARKSIYKLKDEKEILKEELSPGLQLTRQDMVVLLKKAADLIRTRVDYKFILILLFLKRISDKWELEFKEAYTKAQEAGLSDSEAKEEAKASAYHDFNLPEEYIWENIREDVSSLPETLSKALKKIAELNPELKDVVDRADFIQFTTSRENSEILRQLVELFSEKKLHNVAPDLLGDGYEWVLHYFAPQKAKEGEVYTPREVIDLLVEILKPKPEQSVYDPACGSGGMLISSYDYVLEKHGKKEANKLFLYGQEANQTTFALSKMNLYIHDIRDAQIFYGDTLLFPKTREGEELKQFDMVIANPPWNQDGFDEKTLKKGELWRPRFNLGFSTKQSADWIWIQHMLASAKEDGRVGIVIDNGCLFRGGKEKVIRTKALEADLIECIILLPEKLFYNTGAPGAIMIFNKNKPHERKNKILFINASKEFEKHPDVRKLNILSGKNISKIVDHYNKFKEEEGFARVVSLDEIKEQDYNLNVTLYVFPEEEQEDIDVSKEWKELAEMETELTDVKGKIEDYLKEIK